MVLSLQLSLCVSVPLSVFPSPCEHTCNWNMAHFYPLLLLIFKFIFLIETLLHTCDVAEDGSEFSICHLYLPSARTTGQHSLSMWSWGLNWGLCACCANTTNGAAASGPSQPEIFHLIIPTKLLCPKGKESHSHHLPLLSVALINTMRESSLGRRGLVWLTRPNHCLSLGEVAAGTEAEAREQCYSLE